MRTGMKIKKKVISKTVGLIPHHKTRKSLKIRLFRKFNIYKTEQDEAFAHLDKYCAHVDIPYSAVCTDADYQTLPIWQLWLQGKQQAPRLVSKCMNSVEKFGGGREIFILTEHDLANYTDIPGVVWDKYHQGLMENAHFSDIVRSFLLEKHGGTWIDATVLLTAPIPEEFLRQDFFAFAYENIKDPYKVKYYTFGSWFLHAKPNHLLFRKMNKVLLDYWQNENSTVHYFTFHMIATWLIRNDLVLSEVWDRLPKYSEIPPHVLQRNFLEPYSENKWAGIMQGSTVHKLTYFKREQQKMAKYKNTFLDIFLNTDIMA